MRLIHLGHYSAAIPGYIYIEFYVYINITFALSYLHFGTLRMYIYLYMSVNSDSNFKRCMPTVGSKGAVLLLAVALPDNFKHQRDLWFILQQPRHGGYQPLLLTDAERYTKNSAHLQFTRPKETELK